jgi:hypothetical protein
MSKKSLGTWMQVVSIILVLFGLLYTFFGLKVFSGSHYQLVQRDVLLNWESALYGAIMTGWGITLLLVGRVAFRRNDHELKRLLFIGIATWLVIEAGASIWLGVWPNAGVDLAVAILFAIPLLRSR